MIPRSPCKNCEKRITGQTHDSCHAHCHEYKTFRKEMDEFDEARHADHDYEDYVSRVCSKNKKRKHHYEAN